MKPENFNIQELIESLTGTTNTIDGQLPDGMDWNDLTTEDHAKIDEAIFECERCGWWCEIDEQGEDDENFCQDCRESNINL